MSTWTLTPAEAEATTAKITKLNKRATKRGFTGQVTIDTHPVTITETGPGGVPVSHAMVEVTITGQAPRYAGWEFLAAVDTLPTDNGTNYVLRAAPGAIITTTDREGLAPYACQHCNTVRRNRVHTFLVRNTETGEAKQVGKSCIKDFLGTDTSPVFMWQDDIEAGVEGGFGSGPVREYTPATLITYGWACMRAFGWVPRSHGSGATADLVETILFGSDKDRGEVMDGLRDNLDDLNGKGEEIIAFLVDALDDDYSEYTSNLLAAITAPSVPARHIGLVVSAVSAYEKAMGHELRRQEQAKQAENTQHVGAKGEKITVTGTVTTLTAIQSQYGYTPTTSMLVVVTAGSTVVKMFTSAQWAFDIQQGDEVTVAGTVKDHEEYQGVKQTVLTRPKKVPANA